MKKRICQIASLMVLRRYADLAKRQHCCDHRHCAAGDRRRLFTHSISGTKPRKRLPWIDYIASLIRQLPVLATSAILLALPVRGWEGTGAISIVGSSALAGAPGAAPGPAVAALSLSGYALPSTANTVVGVVTTTFVNGETSTSAPLSIVSGGTSSDGSACPVTSDFTIGGDILLQTSSTFTSKNWDYVCLRTAPAGARPFTQLIFLSQTQPQHTAVVAIGDTNTTGSWYPTYAQMIGPDYGWSVNRRGTGDAMTACSASLGTIISDTTGAINVDYRINPVWLLNFGLYEANTFGAGGAGETAFFDCLSADAQWLAVPNANKQLAAAVTSGNKHGAWTNYAATGLSAGTCLQSSDVATPADITFSVNVVAGQPNFAPYSSYPSGNIFVWWGATSSNGTNSGTSITYSLDAGAPTSLAPDDYYTRSAVQTLRLHELSNTTHTVKLTLSTLGPNTTAIVVCAAGTTPRTWATKVELGGVPKAQRGSPYSDYDLDVANVAARLDEQFLDVIYSPTRNYVNLTSDWADATHLNASGQVHLAQAFSENLYKCILDAPPPVVFDPSQYGYTCPIYNEDSSNSVYTYSGVAPVPGYNWYSPGAWPRSAALPTDEWVASAPSPRSHAQLGDSCCSALTYTFTGTIDNGSGTGPGNVLTISGSAAGINGGAVLTWAGMGGTTAPTVIGQHSTNNACSGSLCSVSGGALQVGPIGMTATYYGQSFAPTVNSSPVFQIPVVTTCGTPVGTAAGTPPFIVGTSWGLGFYQEARTSYPKGLAAFWTSSTEFWNSYGFNVTTGLPRVSFNEMDSQDFGSATENIRLWVTVPPVASSFLRFNPAGDFNPNLPKQSGVTNAFLAVDGVDGNGAEQLVLYGSQGAAKSITPVDPWNVIWENHNCLVVTAITTLPVVVNYARVWQRPL